KSLLLVFYILTFLLGSLGLYLFFFPVHSGPVEIKPLEELMQKVDPAILIVQPLATHRGKVREINKKLSTSQNETPIYEPKGSPKTGSGVASTTGPEVASFVSTPTPNNKLSLRPDINQEETKPNIVTNESSRPQEEQKDTTFTQAKTKDQTKEVSQVNPTTFLLPEKENRPLSSISPPKPSDEAKQSTRVIEIRVSPIKRQSAIPQASRGPLFSPPNFESVALVQVGKTEKKSVFALDRWSFGFSFSPDMSSTGLNNFTRPGAKIGGYVEYAISPKLSLQSSLLFSKQKYKGAGSEYTVPEGFWAVWTEGMVPSEIQAVCNIIDISLNLKYYFVNRPRSRFYLSGGFASYILTREAYTYDFGHYSYNDRLATEWLVEDENQHWLGVTNLSAGFEYKINRQLALELEPYLKVPLGGIGFGKVNLFSTGAFLNLKYKLGRK
ncbi:MAG: hypothetical protein AAFU64_05110, partial [Bacteroidota bacterium]